MTTGITSENVKEMLPHFKDVYIAVFNCRNRHKIAGRTAVVGKFGEGAWKAVRAKIRNGIMNIFRTAPTDADRLFVETVAIHSDRYHERRKWQRVEAKKAKG